MIASTVLSLLLVPVLFAMFEWARERMGVVESGGEDEDEATA